MVERNKDTDIQTLLLILWLLEDEFDPYVGEELLDRLQYRLADSEYHDPIIYRLLREKLLERPRRRLSRNKEAEVRRIAMEVIELNQRSSPESTLMRLSYFESKVSEIEGAMNNTTKQLERTREELVELRTSAQDYLWLLSSGVDTSEVKLKRYLPVRIYVSDPLPSQSVLNQLAESVEKLLIDFNFEKTDDFPEESGSWWKRFVLRSREVATNKEVTERLKKAERATEIAMLDKPQAEANHSQAQAAASIITSLAETDNACIQAGSLLVVKADMDGQSAVVVRTLTPLELKQLEENQGLLRKPEEILDWLQNCSKDQLTNNSNRSL